MASPWSMASSGHFDPGQTYDGYKAVEVLDPACTEFLAKGRDCFQHFNPKSSKCHFWFVGKKPCCGPGPVASNVRRYLWSKKDGPLGKNSWFLRALLLMLLRDNLIRDVERWTNVGGSISVGGRLIYSSSAVPISRINPEGVVKRIRRIFDSPSDLDSEGSDKLSGEEITKLFEATKDSWDQGDDIINVEVDHNDKERLHTETPKLLNETIHDETPPASPQNIQAFQEREEIKDDTMGQEDITVIMPDPEPKMSSSANVQVIFLFCIEEFGDLLNYNYNITQESWKRGLDNINSIYKN
ncbi:hypothetical protein O181_093670 [Austropuccinia psidii MF-1]|uniref:Uncharacterized protein n=1 Tax=Austropuccinia psidii MF-1 TaxID=1389203 RepID=A0A9Q3PAC0_9BASI|nr:hypothetical protein [Austropuccinia psidii MF-1]